MKNINKNFRIPRSLKYLQCEQQNGDILFILRDTEFAASYGNTERDISELKSRLIAILYLSNGLLCLNNSAGFTSNQQLAANQIERDYKEQIQYVEGGNTTFVDKL